MALEQGTQVNPFDPVNQGGGFLDDVDGTILESGYVMQPPREGGSGITYCALRWNVQPMEPNAGPVEVHYRVGKVEDFVPTPDGEYIQSVSGKPVWEAMDIAFLGAKLQNLGIAPDDLSPASKMVGRMFHFEAVPSGGTKTDGTPYKTSVPTVIVGDAGAALAPAAVGSATDAACGIVMQLIAANPAPCPYGELAGRITSSKVLVGHAEAAGIGPLLMQPFNGAFWTENAGKGKGFQIVDGNLQAE
ncbi:MAG: hypothetical protein KAJ19_08915 [Gammaproteobacteria bacterium]|nr:hypothetical protein [Gammaproteobacteria bacterium]